MRPAIAVGVYVLLVFIGGALLAPLVYWPAQRLTGAFPGLQEIPFHRYLNRTLLVLALAGLWPLLRFSDASSPRDLGLPRLTGEWRRLGAGFVFGFVTLALTAGLALTFGIRTFKADLNVGVVMEKLLIAATGAAAVAIVEEILFRGVLYGALRKSLKWQTALAISSLFYALVHFLENAPGSGPVTWLTGLETLPRMLTQAGHARAVPGFLTLTVAGVLLGIAYQRTGTLYFSIGLHAGWVFWLKSYAALTARVPGIDTTFWGGARLINGWVALVVLTIALGGFLAFPRGKDFERRE